MPIRLPPGSPRVGATERGEAVGVLRNERHGHVQRAAGGALRESEALPKVETMPQQPLSPYAASKAANEGMMRAWANCYGFDTVALRYFNIFGPRQTADSA